MHASLAYEVKIIKIKQGQIKLMNEKIKNYVCQQISTSSMNIDFLRIKPKSI